MRVAIQTINFSSFSVLRGLSASRSRAWSASKSIPLSESRPRKMPTSFWPFRRNPFESGSQSRHRPLETFNFSSQKKTSLKRFLYEEEIFKKLNPNHRYAGLEL